MTVPSSVNKITYMGDDVSTVFPFPYYFLADEDLTVIKVAIATGAESTLVLNTDYTVTGEGDPAGGAVTLTDPLLDEYHLIIRREVELKQNTDFNEGEGEPAETLEECFDRLTMMCQQLQEQISRSILINLPTLIAGYLYSDGSTMTWTGLTATNYSGTISRGVDASKAVAPAAGDIYIATDTLKVYVCYSAGTWSNLVSIHDLAAKTSLVDNDVLLLEDSAASYALKKITRANLKTDITDACVKLSGNQTVNGIKTFGSFPITPSSAPTTDYMTANKKYVDDVLNAVGGFDNTVGEKTISTTLTTLASVTINTVAGRKVMLTGSVKIRPHATDDPTLTVTILRDTTVLDTYDEKVGGLDVSGGHHYMALTYYDTSAGTAATTYTIKATTGAATACYCTGRLTAVQVK